MDICDVDIAGQTLSLQTESSQFQDWLHHSFQWHRTTGDQPVDMVVHIDDACTGQFQNFNVQISSGGSHVIYRRADYVIRADHDYTQAIISAHDTLALKHALMNLYSAFIVHRGAGLLVHSACVVQDKHAYLFSGRSGAGKSTVARLSAPRPLLSNEATIIRLHDAEATAYNSFPFRSDPGEFVPGPFPLRGIHFLRQSTQVNRTRVPVANALMELMHQVFFWAHTPVETVKIAQMIKRLVRLVPAYELHFQENSSFWREIS